MTTKKMSIHRALTELKHLDDRISNAIKEVTVIKAHRKQDAKINNKTVEEAIQLMQSSYDKVVALIEYRARIKEAVVQSNATTIVQVAGEEMTVAKAIERKESINYERRLHATIADQYRKEVGKYNKEQEALPARLETYIVSTLGPKEKVKSEDVEMLTKTFTERNEFTLSSPFDVESKIEAIGEVISNFETEVDTVLSESNAVTMIEVAV